MRKVNNFKEYNILLGKRLREIRIEMKLSQKDIGNILDVSFQQVQKYESGQNHLSCASAAALCEELAINIQDIFPAVSRKRRSRKDKAPKDKAPMVVHLHYGRLL